MQLSCSHLKMQSSGRPTPRLGCIVRGSERGRNFNFVFLILSRIWPYWLIFYELPKLITKIGKLRIQTCKGVGIGSEFRFWNSDQNLSNNKRTNHCLNLACYLILNAIQYVFQRTFSKTKQSKIPIYNTITAKMPLRKNALKKEI